MDKKICSLDRLEGDLAVCISDDDDVVVVPISRLGGLRAGDVFRARLEDDTLAEIEPDEAEREHRLAENRERLHALARKTKNRR